MIAALKAEILKILTVRSTYALLAFILAVNALMCGYAKGYKLTPGQLLDPGALQQTIGVAVMVMTVFAAIVGVLALTHEYRYNTMLYTLTANRSRTVALLAKIAAVTIFSLVVTALIAVTAPLLTVLGVHIAGHTLVTQQLWYSDIIWRVLFYGWGYAMLTLLIAAIVRNQVAAIVTIFIIPSTIEGILQFFLKDKSTYLPFTLLGAVIDKNSVVSYAQAATLFIVYLVVGWLIAWGLFLRRDAN